MSEEELELFSAAFSSEFNSIDRSFPSDARAKPERPEGGTAGGASARRVEQRHGDD
jgi:hypothetical protein